MVEHMSRATLNTLFYWMHQILRATLIHISQRMITKVKKCRTNNVFIVLSHIPTLSACTFLDFRYLNFAFLAFMYRSETLVLRVEK